MNFASQIATIIAAPLAAIPAGASVHSGFRSLDPEARLKKWEQRVEHISSVICQKEEHVTPDEMRAFLRLLKEYTKARDAYRTLVKSGSCKWYNNKGKEEGNHFALQARNVYEIGMSTSTEASFRKGESYLRNIDPGPTSSVLTVSSSSTWSLVPSVSTTWSITSAPGTSTPIPTPYNNLPYTQAITDSDSNTQPYLSADDTRSVLEDHIGDDELLAVHNVFRSIPEEKNNWRTSSMASIHA